MSNDFAILAISPPGLTRSKGHAVQWKSFKAISPPGLTRSKGHTVQWKSYKAISQPG